MRAALALLDKSWIQRIATVVFLAGVGKTVWRIAVENASLDAAAVVLTAAGVVLLALPALGRSGWWARWPGRSSEAILDERIRAGQEVREWMRFYRPPEDEARRRTMAWMLRTGNLLAERLPAAWDDYLTAGGAEGVGLSQLIEAVDLKLEPLKAMRQDRALAPRPERSELADKARAELVAAIDDGLALGPDAFRGPDYGPYVLWRDETSDFLATVFGSTERQRFAEAYEPPPTNLNRNLEDHLRRLRELRDRPEQWEMQINEEGLRKAARERRHRLEAERVLSSTKRPSLSFGQAEIPARSTPMTLRAGDGEPRTVRGRVIRVPVSNAQGSTTAREIHARITFMPGDLHRSYAPRYSAQGEWADEGEPSAQIDLPGNGRARFLDVLMVLDVEYPHAFEWSRKSRASGLNGFQIKANPVEILIEVNGTDEAVALSDTLTVVLQYRHMIRADWASAGPDEASNWVEWD